MASKKRAKKKQPTRKGSTRKSSTRKRSVKRKTTKKAAKRTLIAPKGDKRYVRRSKQGRFKESDDVGKSLSTDRRRTAKRKAPSGQGDKGD